MGGVAKAVTKVASKAVETVGDAVEDVGNAVVEEVVKPIAKTVEATVEAAANDPIGTAVKVAAISTMNPAIIAAANAGVAVANGASLEDAALAAGKGYIAGAVGAEVSSGLSPEFAASGDLTASQAATAANIAGNVAGTTVVGGDPLQALVSGGVGAATSALTTEIPGFGEMSKAQQRAVNAAISKTLQGKDPSQTLINEAIASGITAAQNYSSAPSDSLVDQTITGSDVDIAPEAAPAPSSEIVSQTIPEEQVIAQAPIPEDLTPQDQTTESAPSSDLLSQLGTAPAEEIGDVGGVNVNGGYYDEITGKFIPSEYGQLTAPLDDTSGTNYSSMDGYEYNPETRTWVSPDGTVTDLSYLESSNKPLDTGSLDYLNAPGNGTDLGELARSLLKLAPKAAYGTGIAMGANALFGGDNSKDGYGNLTYSDGSQSVSWNPQDSAISNGVYYGTDQLGGQFTKDAAQGGIMSLAHGGQIPSLGSYASGGNPRLLRGPGDGMSDNIPATIAGKQPARLADGEFVIPADVVSHLGNGSTEAGAKVLHQMMERVRKARTGNPNQGNQINAQKFVPRKGK